MDQLEITALRLNTRIGIHAWESRILQEIRLDIQIPIDLSTVNDQITHTIDYTALCQCIKDFVETRTFNLIETLADEVAARIKTTFPSIKTLTLRVSKPHAVPSAQNISITVHR